MDTVKCDLHGLKHEEAEQKVISLIEENFKKNKMIRFITGNSSEMQKIVHGVIEEYELKSSNLCQTEVVVWT